MALIFPEECRHSVNICWLYWSFSAAPISLIYFISYLGFCRHFLPIFLTSNFIPLQSSFYSAVRVVVPTVKTDLSIAHCKVLWLFPNAHKIISRLLSLDYQLFSVSLLCTFPALLLPFSKIITKSCQTTHSSLNMNFLHAYIPLDVPFLLPRPY